MTNRFDELTKGMAQSVTRREAFQKFSVALTGVALVCLGPVNVGQAQTSVVCDPAGDAIYGSGKGGPKVPPWLDIVQSTITNAGDSILFTLALNGSVPPAPAWENADDSGQFWWGWRLVNDAANLTFVSNGCVLGKGKNLPEGYFLDLIWNVQTASFHARLLDDTLCAEIAVPFAFTPDRTQVTLTVSKASVVGTALIPNPNTFQYFAQTLVWKANSIGNTSFYSLDVAPDSSWASWSSSSATAYGCP